MDKDTLKILLPWLIGTAVIGALLALLAIRFLPRQIQGMPAIVTLDVVKLGNAKRAFAAGLIKKDDDTILMLREVGSRTLPVIKKIAGTNTVVIIKQALVHGDLYDITDDVLKELGLPTEVPTSSMENSVKEIVPDGKHGVLGSLTPEGAKVDERTKSILP